MKTVFRVVGVAGLGVAEVRNARRAADDITEHLGHARLSTWDMLGAEDRINGWPLPERCDRWSKSSRRIRRREPRYPGAQFKVRT